MNAKKEDLTNEIKGKIIVHWNYRGLAELPEALRSCAPDLREIYLKDNALTNLPNWIIELVNLTHLYLHGNNLKKVPSQLAKMANLTLLDLGDNGLYDLPTSLGDLESLESLTLDNNYLKKLPSEMRNLKNLCSLSVCKNEFVALPEWLGSLDKLEQIRADENSLRELPNRLANSLSLSVVSICSNRLTYLPLNGFVSRPSVYFSSNPRLNYLSYPMFRQLHDNPGNREVATGKIRTLLADDPRECKNLQIFISSNEGEKSIIELPRQLFKIHSVGANEPASLWELALRRVYDYQRDTGQWDNPNHGASYNLLDNGPIAVCVNENCRGPIFTETWLIPAVSCPQDSISKSVTIVALYCSQNCALSFSSISEGLESLRWNLVR